MPVLLRSRHARRRPRPVLVAAILILAATGSVSLARAAPAAADATQIAIIQDDIHVLANPTATMATFRALGAQYVRVFLTWSAIAPDPVSNQEPSGFDPSNPADYPAGAWSRWDAVDRAARRDGLSLDFVLTGGAPHWAEGRHIPSPANINPNRAWYPSAQAFEQFVTAAGRRYSGSFPDPEAPGESLPRVSFWSIWNEPNFGEDLAPQATDGSRKSVAPGMYRSLVDAAWSGLGATGHMADTILIGELAARGLSARATPSHPQGLPGDFAQTKPLAFIRTLYCVGAGLKPLRGSAATQVGCPATTAGIRQFRSQHPGLFRASGFSDHPYPQDLPPTRERSKDPDFAAFSEIPSLERELDGIQRTYGSGTRFPIYNTEYGYITHPPNRGRFVSPTVAAGYLNWAEYLSWRARRIRSTMQYLLYDPQPSPQQPDGGFASGLLTWGGRRKPAFAAYRMPLYLPVASGRRGAPLEVWGGVRPAPYAARDTGKAQYVQIQLQSGSHGAYRTVARVKISSPRGYFDTRVRFPAAGTVRLAWSYPSGDNLLPQGTIYSRGAPVAIR